jgi:undecaprenyl-diphosphatase
VPRLLRWPYADLAPDFRKTFDVALHAGSAPALLLALRRSGLGDVRPLVLTLIPAALVGGPFERTIERRLGGVRMVAAAQVLGGVMLIAADGRPERRPSADTLDYLLVGLAQAAALVPGVSRSGAALSAGRWRRLTRACALRLSLRAALPVTAAAGALKGVRTARGDVPAELRPALAAGALAALVSALASLRLLPLLERAGFVRALACYRIALGVAVLLHEAHL